MKRRQNNKRPPGTWEEGKVTDKQLKQYFYDDFKTFLYDTGKKLNNSKVFKRDQINFSFKIIDVKTNVYLIKIIMQRSSLFNDKGLTGVLSKDIRFDLNEDTSKFIKHVKFQTEALNILIRAKFKINIDSTIPTSIYTPFTQKDFYF